MNKKKTVSAKEEMRVGKKIFLGAIAFFLLAAVGTGCFFLGWNMRYRALPSEIRELVWALDRIDKIYTKDFSEEDFYTDLWESLNARLDPYSEYYTAEEYRTVIEQGMGEYRGIGVQIYGGERAQLYKVMENSPACRAGIEADMFVFGFGEREEGVAEGDLSQLSEFLEDREGSFFLRCGFEEDGSDAKNYLLQREAFQAAYCSYADSEGEYGFRGEETLVFTRTGEGLPALDGQTAYIRIDAFRGNAAAEFTRCLAAMKERGRKNLILDLRFNGGGYMNVFTEIAAHLCKDATENRPVVCDVRYKDGSTAVYRAKGNDYYDYFSEDSVLTLLANSGSASASECLIGAMVDYGTLPFENIRLEDYGNGARTYGKGIMQTTYESGSGGAIKLTSADIFWPLSGKSIHGVGVTAADGAKVVSVPRPVSLRFTLNKVIGEVCHPEA